MLQITIWCVPPLLAALVGAGTYLRLRSKKRVPGMFAVLTLLAAMLFWAGAQFVGAVFTDPGIKILATKFAYFGIVLAPVAWLVFAMSYTRRQMHMSPRVLNLICIIPLITLLLVVTNEWHQLIWTEIQLVRDEGVVGLVMTYGSWFWLHSIYSYLLIIIATTILAHSIHQATGELKPVLAVVFAPVVACLANLFYLSPWNPSPWFDLTTLGFAVAAMILDDGVLRFGILDSIPVLRDRVVEELTDGVVVINHQGAIIDANSSALRILETTRGDLGDTIITDFIRSVPLDAFTETRGHSLEVTLRERAYDITTSELDQTDPLSDHVLVFHDMTSYRRKETELQAAQERLDRLAHTDPLTGLHNRRFFMDRLKEEVERVRRHGSLLSVLLVDLDYFKRINDSYGHETGDNVLKAVAGVAAQIKRITDVAARIGGEEFALLLPETDQRGAVHLANRLRESIENIHVPGLSKSREITASIGVATVSHEGNALDDVLNLADEALYRAKNAGRNRVCCAN